MTPTLNVVLASDPADFLADVAFGGKVCGGGGGGGGGVPDFSNSKKHSWLVQVLGEMQVDFFF